MDDRTTARPHGWLLVAGLAGLATALQLWGLYRPAGPPSAPWFPYADKAEHAIGFAVPVALLLIALGLRPAARSLLSAPVVVLVVALFGCHAVLSEVVQHAFYTSRTGDPLDVLADLVGVALGVVSAQALLRRRPHDGAAERPVGPGWAGTP